jgi:hypothetical protein
LINPRQPERVIGAVLVEVGVVDAHPRTMCGSRTGGWSLLGVMSD